VLTVVSVRSFYQTALRPRPSAKDLGKVRRNPSREAGLDKHRGLAVRCSGVGLCRRSTLSITVTMRKD